MADRAIGELLEAREIKPGDLLLVEQDGTAKKLSGQTMITFLTKLANGIGGFAEPLRKISSSGLVDTYQATYTNGDTSLLLVTNGAKGDKGDNAYVHIKYASKDPKDPPHSMGNMPDNWMGVYTGSRSSAPGSWSDYQWMEIKGQQGDPGEPAKLVTGQTVYQAGTSAVSPPAGSWVSSPPAVSKGQYLWSKTTVGFNTGSPITIYGVSYMGRDGSGTVKTVAGIEADPDGEVPLTAKAIGAVTSADINAAHVVKENIQIPASAFRTYSPVGAETKLHDRLGYTYRASVAVAGVASNMIPNVTLDLADVEAAGVDIANQFSCYNGGVYVYASGLPAVQITALTVECGKKVF